MSLVVIVKLLQAGEPLMRQLPQLRKPVHLRRIILNQITEFVEDRVHGRSHHTGCLKAVFMASEGVISHPGFGVDQNDVERLKLRPEVHRLVEARVALILMALHRIDKDPGNQQRGRPEGRLRSTPLTEVEDSPMSSPLS